jgi:hypothetical protein
MMPKMKKTKKHNSKTLPSIGSVSSNSMTRIRIPERDKVGIINAGRLKNERNHFEYCMELECPIVYYNDNVLFCTCVDQNDVSVYRRYSYDVQKVYFWKRNLNSYSYNPED